MPIGEPKETNSNKATRIQSRSSLRKSSTHTVHEKEDGGQQKYYRDTLGLGNKGARNTNIGVQCDIKIAAGHYRQLQRQCIDMRLEKEKMIARERELEDRINRLIEEKEKLNTAYKKISKQSYTAHYILQKERLVTQTRQINILT